MKRSVSGSLLKPSGTFIGNSLKETAKDFLEHFSCSICFNLFEEPYVTNCGHTFCYECLKRCLIENQKCMTCGCLVEQKDICPNYTLNNLIQFQKNKIEQINKSAKRNKKDGSYWNWKSLLAVENDNFQLSDVECMLKVLQDKRKQIIQESDYVNNKVLLEFLQELRKRKQLILSQLKTELGVIDTDLCHIENILSNSAEDMSLSSLIPNEDHGKKEQLVPKPSSSKTSKHSETVASSSSKYNENTVGTLYQTLSQRRYRLQANFDELESCYLTCRVKQSIVPSKEDGAELLGSFSNKLQRFMQYSSIRPIASLNYVGDILNQSSIVSSIDFDKNGDHFAVAGVTKKIKIYDYQSVISSPDDGNHCPLTQMSCNSKISCISWSHYHHNWLASSDYEGSVVIWDAFKAQKYRVFQEHEKRCWSVDFNSVDPRLIASGSDDAKVKLWSTEMLRSVGVIEAKANVCCVQFNPHSAMHLVFGGADHFLHYYDIRNTTKPLSIFKGHKKAVSYTKFIDKDHIVSASTDSELRLWKADETACVRTFQGHRNEKNFVGLAASGEYVACGSEDNSLYIYYKGFSKSLLTHKFNVVKSVLEPDKHDNEGKEFVSAVTWRTNSNVIVAANSQGTIKVLELV